jgi:orotidine-5'-phosphate decarboxylase
MTVHPEMGSDSVHPFFELAHQNQQGVYVLTRTTNDGAEDFQDKVSEDQPMYMHIAENVVEWSEEYPGTVGSVAAGNKTEELREIASLLSGADADIPLLIPGVGTQGGEADEVINTLLEVDYDPRLARINSSSGVMYRAQKDGRPREEHAEASVGELRELNQATDFEVEFVR